MPDRNFILEKHWMSYIQWWLDNLKGKETGPTDAGFWAWYAEYKINEPKPMMTSLEVPPREDGNPRSDKERDQYIQEHYGNKSNS